MAAVDLRYARALAAVISNQKLDVVATQGQLNDFADTLEAHAALLKQMGRDKEGDRDAAMAAAIRHLSSRSK